MSNSSKLTNILDQAFDKPWEKYSAEEYKIQLEETKSKVRELTPEQELKLMNKRMKLRIQVTANYKKDRHGSKATRKRYYQAACYACDYIAGTCNLQKFVNFHPKHFREVAEYWKTTKDLNTVYTELTGLRQYCEYAGCKYKIPENKELNLPKREPTKYNRAWLPHEIQRAKELAEMMRRFDVRDAIELGEKLGLRIIEACQLKIRDVKSALGWGGSEIKGKGGQIRFIPIETEEQKELLQRLYRKAKEKGLMEGDFVLSKTIKYGPMREKKSIENWIYAFIIVKKLCHFIFRRRLFHFQQLTDFPFITFQIPVSRRLHFTVFTVFNVSVKRAEERYFELSQHILHFLDICC